MPGGLRVPSAEAAPAGATTVELLSGAGYRKGLLAPDHRFGRVLGDLAVAYQIIPTVAVGIELDGRYDVHYGLAPSGEHGEVGDPHLFGRYVSQGSGLRFGAELGLWLPGQNAPSVTASAISVEGKLFATLPAGPGKLSAMAGFQLDNSAKSASNAAMLTVQDQVSLGVSSFDEVYGGLRYGLAFGKTFLSGEASTEVFVGSGAPSPIFRGTVSAGAWLTKGIALMAYVELASVPSPSAASITANAIPLIPYEPMIGGQASRIEGTFESAVRSRAKATARSSRRTARGTTRPTARRSSCRSRPRSRASSSTMPASRWSARR